MSIEDMIKDLKAKGFSRFYLDHLSDVEIIRFWEGHKDDEHAN